MFRSSRSAFRRSSRRLAAGLCTAVVASSLVVAASTSVQAAASIEVVKQSSLGNWLLGHEGVAGGSHEFVAGPGSAPIGAGSLQMSLTNANQGYVAALPNAVPGQTALTDLQTLSYSTYRSAGSSASWQIALQFNADYDVTDTDDVWQGRLVYEPYETVGNTNAGEWYTWDALASNGRWWGTGTNVLNNSPMVGGVRVAQPCTQSSPCTLTQLLAAFPDVGFRGGTSNVLLLKAGSNWDGFVGSVDNLNIQVGGNDVTYDFEPETPYNPPTTKKECKKGGWATFENPAFKNQGDCVSFVASGGKKAPKG